MHQEEEIRKERLKEIKALKKKGIDIYPARVRRTHTIEQALSQFTVLSRSQEQLTLVGRILSLRKHGGLSFLNLQDGTASIQVLVGRNTLGPKAYDFFLNYFHVGDFVQVKGSLFKTKSGEKTLKGEEIKIISKALRPWPSQWYGLKDIETRYRKRYLDLVFNKEVKEKFKIRTKIIQEIRKFLNKRGFLEVETPILQVQYGGAKAKPFITHLEALDLDLYLRISPELYLKRLLIGGFEKVYEIARDFRNEGIDQSHNPEFTMLEFYWAYADYKDLMHLTEEMFRDLLKALFGKLTITYQGKKINFHHPWKRIEFNQLFHQYTKIDLEEVNLRALRKKAKELKVEIPRGASKPEIADQIYKKYCRPQIWEPTFIIHHPRGSFPLAKELSKNPAYTENFQLVVANWELINAFSEQNNPLVQEEIFKEQEKNYQHGFAEAQRMDKDFLTALEYGMPPAAGLGLGIDRLTALLTNSQRLREIILFPTMKPNA